MLEDFGYEEMVVMQIRDDDEYFPDDEIMVYLVHLRMDNGII
jgi:hypothetical protein